MNDTLLEFENVGVMYRRRLNLFGAKNHILRELTFNVERGETLGVVGRNGAGKSTLLKLLADIIKPDSGAIRRREKLRSQLLSLNLGFNNSLSGRDNAVMALVTQGRGIREAKSLVTEILEYGDIQHLGDQPLGTYSAGERARLGFSIAISTAPDILLLDEILGVGDKDFRERSSKELKARARSDQTVVLVSHSISTLKDLCDRVLWIESGTVKLIGDTERVLTRYSEPKIPA